MVVENAYDNSNFQKMKPAYRFYSFECMHEKISKFDAWYNQLKHIKIMKSKN